MRLVNVARPLPSVATVVVPVKVPVPVATAATTLTPLRVTLAPPTVWSRTLGAVLNTCPVADWLGWVTITNVLAPVTLRLPEETPVSPLEVYASVWVPVPRMARLVKVAIPELLVTTLVVPPMVPVPVPIAAVTVTPGVETTALSASRS
jgi:hypothetical protein